MRNPASAMDPRTIPRATPGTPSVDTLTIATVVLIATAMTAAMTGVVVSRSA